MQDSGHTPEWNGPTVERVMRNGKRIYVSAFKAWLVEQALKPEVCKRSIDHALALGCPLRQ